MAIFILPDEMLRQILQYVDIQDKIAFAYACNRFRENNDVNRWAFREVNLSSSIVRRKHGAIKEFLRDNEMAEHIRELDLSNHRVLNWQMDKDLEKFIFASCPQLEALHVLQTGIRLKNLNSILQHAPKLVKLSFSMMDLSQEDIDFMMQNSPNSICLGKVKQLRIGIRLSGIHIPILNWLLLSCCKDLEELEIYIWDLPDISEHEIFRNRIELGFLDQWSTPTTELLPHFHSFTAQIVNFCNPSRSNLIASRITDLIISIATKKAPGTNWKKFWISPPIDGDLLNSHGLSEFHSVEAISAAFTDVNKVKILFDKINDSVVGKLQLHTESFNELCLPIGRIGGKVLRCLSLSRVIEFYNMDLNAKLKKLFSICANISELDLIGCHFQINICESLSKLKHLSKIQLQQCAVGRSHTSFMDKANEKFSTFVENSPNVVDFYIRGCYNSCNLSRLVVSDDLLAIAKWKNLESLACINMSLTPSGCNQTSPALFPEHSSTFLKNIFQDCKSLTMLRISIMEYNNESYFTSLQFAKFLKHLSMEVREANLGEENFWKVLSYASNLERLCIRTNFIGFINIHGALEMVKSLSRLHLLHAHFISVKNVKLFIKYLMQTLEEEKSDRMHSFELLMQEECYWPQRRWTFNKLLPLNSSELCFVMPTMALPKI